MHFSEEEMIGPRTYDLANCFVHDGIATDFKHVIEMMGGWPKCTFCGV